MARATSQKIRSPASQFSLGVSRSSGRVGNATANAAIVTAVAVGALYFGKPVFIPFAIAVLVAFVLSPVVTILRRFRLPRIVAVPLVVAANFALLLSIGVVMSDQIRDLAGDLPHYEQTLREKVRDLRHAVTSNPTMERAAKTLQDLQSELEGNGQTQKSDNVDDNVAQLAPGTLRSRESRDGVTKQSRPVQVEIHNPELSPFENLLSLLTPLVEPAAIFAIVVVLVLFMLMQKEELRDRFIRLMGAADLQRTTSAMTVAGQRLSRFFLTLTALNLTYGVFIAVALWTLGVPAPVLWGILAALMRFVPFIGSFIAAAFPIALAAAIAPGWMTMLLTLGLFVVSEALMGQVIEPLVQGRSTGLSPLAILISAAFWTLLWGPVGLFLAIPMTLCLVVIGQHVESLSFIHVLLGDEPAFTPQERFYQRTLAGDATEITELAEQHMKEVPLSCYYSEIAVGALQLAQVDANRTLIDTEHMERIEKTVETMVDNLWEYPDQYPKNSKAVGEAVEEMSDERHNDKEGECSVFGTADLPVLQRDKSIEDVPGSSSVLCVPAHTPIDRAAAHILSQVLHAHGVEADVVDRDDIQMVGHEQPVAHDVQVICVCSVGDQMAPARYLARRIARRRRNSELVIALWGADQDKAGAFTDSYPEIADSVTVNMRDTASRIIDALRSSDPEAATKVNDRTAVNLSPTAA